LYLLRDLIEVEFYQIVAYSLEDLESLLVEIQMVYHHHLNDNHSHINLFHDYNNLNFLFVGHRVVEMNVMHNLGISTMDDDDNNYYNHVVDMMMIFVYYLMKNVLVLDFADKMNQLDDYYNHKKHYD
jgi:hypothetical protein